MKVEAPGDSLERPNPSEHAFISPLPGLGILQRASNRSFLVIPAENKMASFVHFSVVNDC